MLESSDGGIVTLSGCRHGKDNMYVFCPGAVNFLCSYGVYVLSGWPVHVTVYLARVCQSCQADSALVVRAICVV